MPDLNQEFNAATKEELVDAISAAVDGMRSPGAPPFASNRRIDPYAYRTAYDNIESFRGIPWDSLLFLTFFYGDTQNQRLLNAVFPSFLAETDFSHLHNT